MTLSTITLPATTVRTYLYQLMALMAKEGVRLVITHKGKAVAQMSLDPSSDPQRARISEGLRRAIAKHNR